VPLRAIAELGGFYILRRRNNRAVSEKFRTSGATIRRRGVLFLLVDRSLLGVATYAHW